MFNIADGLPMMALRMTAPHLRIANSTFTYNFIICDRLPDTEIIFGIDVQKNFLTIICLGQREELLHTEGQQISQIQPKNCEQKVTIGIFKSTLKIPSRHIGIMPIKIKSPTQSQDIQHASLVIKNQ